MRIASFVFDRTIGRKLMLLATVSVSIGLTLACAAFVAYGIYSLNIAKWEQLNSQARLLALNSGAAVEFKDSAQADRLLSALRSESSVKTAALYSADGDLVGSYPSQADAELSFREGIAKASGSQTLDQPVESDGETVGHLKFLIDFASVDTAMHNYAILTIVVGFGAWIIAVAVAFYLQRGIVRPIGKLAVVARKVSSEGNYSLRVEGKVTGELADMYQAFNGMLTQIQSSKQELQELNDNLEQRVADRTNELALALIAAESASRSKSDFLANMSHEIRTPLNAIMGFADMLHRGWVESDEERNQMLSTVHSSGRHLMTILNDILDLSKIESGCMGLEIRSESPHSVISEVVSLMRVSFRENNLTLDYFWQGPVPSMIQTDTARLRQILINLIGNARKFTPSGGVQLIVRLDRSLETPQLVIDVIDTGIGIPMEKQECIFEPFVQADSSVTRKFGGTGLGLSISRKMARLMGGDLTVQSKPGEGCDFQLRIPVGNLEDVEFTNSGAVGDIISIRTPLTEPFDVGQSLCGLRVLVVEDGSANRKLLSVILRRAGAIMTEAENGKIACEIVASHPDFDVILLDMQMPIMDGYSAAKKIREMGITVPIFALTAHAMKGDREKCIGAGCSGFLTKPIKADELLQSLGLIRIKDGQETNKMDAARDPIYSKLPTEDPEFAEIVFDFISAIRNEVIQLSAAVQNRDSMNTRRVAHWIKGSGGSAGFPCFTYPAEQVTDAVHKNQWTVVERHLNAIIDYTDRLQNPECPSALTSSHS